MPIVDIEIVLRTNETFGKEMVSELADELSDIFHSPRRGTWVKLRGLPDDHYGENGGTADGPYPIFVTIIKAEWQTPPEMQQEVKKITGTVAQICGRPSENVHVIYAPPAKGRVAFGGKLLS